MAKYLIHSTLERQWYVEDYLVPSMLNQGIAKEDIDIWQDVMCEGNFPAFMNSMVAVGKLPGGTWHLQDDIIIASDFKERTEERDYGIVTGFCSSYDTDLYIPFNKSIPVGIVPIQKMWYSFQCIRIPNVLAKEFVQWYHTEGINDVELKELCEKQKKGDDSAFRKFLEAKYPDLTVYNLNPNLVDHIDYLIGGTLVNEGRGNRNTRAVFWTEPHLVAKLADDLHNSKI